MCLVGLVGGGTKCVIAAMYDMRKQHDPFDLFRGSTSYDKRIVRGLSQSQKQRCMRMLEGACGTVLLEVVAHFA